MPPFSSPDSSAGFGNIQLLGMPYSETKHAEGVTGGGVNNEYFKFWTGSADREKEVVDFVTQTRNSIQAARREREAVWLECYQIYRQIHAKNSYEGRSKIYLPSGFVSVETIAPRLILGLLGTTPFMKLAPRKNATEDRARKISKLLQLQADQADFFWHFMNFIKQMTIYGRGRGKVWWDRRYKKVVRKGVIPKMRPGMDGTPEMYSELGPVTQDDLIFDGPRFRTVDPFRLFEDLEAYSIDESVCQIERVIKREYALKDGEKMGYYGNLKELSSLKSNGNGLYSPSEVERMKASGVNVDGIWDSENKYDASEMYGLFDINQDGVKEECKITTLADKRLICIEENPWWHKQRPYVDCPYIPVDQELDGIGVLEPIKHLMYEMNDTHNQVMDNKTLMLNTMWLMDENAQIRVSDLKMRPGGVIRTRDMKGLQALRPNDFTSAGYNAFGLLERIMKEATGATNPIIGQTSGGDQTATEITSLISEGNVRTKLTMKLIEERALKRIFRLWYSLDEQLMNRNVYIRAVENGQPQDLMVTPDDIYGEYDFEPQGAIQIQQEAVKNQQKVAFFNIAAKYAPQVIPYLMISIWKDLDQRGGEELEKIFLANPAATTGLMPQQPGPMGAPANLTNTADILKQNTNQGR